MQGRRRSTLPLWPPLRVRRHLLPQQGDGFRRIAHLGVAVVEQPLGQGRARQADLSQSTPGDQPFPLAAQQHMHGPGGIGGSGGREMVDQRLHPCAGGAGAVELFVQLAEGAHQPVSSPSRSATNPPASGSALMPSTSRR